MPVYEFKCSKKGCKFHLDQFLFSDNISRLTREEKDRKQLGLVCPKHNIVLDRVYGVPAVITNQHQSLAKKQAQKKTRSRAHFKNEVLPTIKDPAERRHFENKFKNTRKIDHTKL